MVEKRWVGQEDGKWAEIAGGSRVLEVQNDERNITTRIGGIAGAEYEKWRGADRNPKEENMYFRGNFRVGGEICRKYKFFYFYIVFSDIYKCVYS